MKIKNYNEYDEFFEKGSRGIFEISDGALRLRSIAIRYFKNDKFYRKNGSSTEWNYGIEETYLDGIICAEEWYHSK